MAEQPESLHALFTRAKSLKKSLEESTETNSSEYREQLHTAIAKFAECQRLIAQLSLFSDNETVEDIATGDLRYNLVPLNFYLLSFRKIITCADRFLPRLDI